MGTGDPKQAEMDDNPVIEITEPIEMSAHKSRTSTPNLVLDPEYFTSRRSGMN